MQYGHRYVYSSTAWRSPCDMIWYVIPCICLCLGIATPQIISPAAGMVSFSCMYSVSFLYPHLPSRYAPYPALMTISVCLIPTSQPAWYTAMMPAASFPLPTTFKYGVCESAQFDVCGGNLVQKVLDKSQGRVLRGICLLCSAGHVGKSGFFISNHGIVHG